MKKFFINLLKIATVAIFLLSSSALYAEELTISVINFCPFHCLDSATLQPDKNLPGYDVEIYREIFGKAGYQVKFVNQPFNRGMVETDEGRVDAVSGPLKFSGEALKDKIRQLPNMGHIYGRLIYPDKAVALYHASCFFVRGDSSWKYDGVDSLHGFKIGSVRDFDYGTIINAYFEKLRKSADEMALQELKGKDLVKRNLMKLKLERVDIVLGDRNNYSYAIKTMADEGTIPSGSIKLSGCTPEGRAPLYIGFTPKTPEKSEKLARIYDIGIERLRKSGELQKILDKYGIKDWNYLEN